MSEPERDPAEAPQVAPEDDFASDHASSKGDRARRRVTLLKVSTVFTAAYGALIKMAVPASVALLRGEGLDGVKHEVTLQWVPVAVLAWLLRRASPLRFAFSLAAALGGLAHYIVGFPYFWATYQGSANFELFSRFYFGLWSAAIFGAAGFILVDPSTRDLMNGPEPGVTRWKLALLTVVAVVGAAVVVPMTFGHVDG